MADHLTKVVPHKYVLYLTKFILLLYENKKHAFIVFYELYYGIFIPKNTNFIVFR